MEEAPPPPVLRSCAEREAASRHSARVERRGVWGVRGGEARPVAAAAAAGGRGGGPGFAHLMDRLGGVEISPE